MNENSIFDVGTNGGFTIVSVNGDDFSSKFSINGTTPESWSGTRLCYVKFREFAPQTAFLDAELWICNVDLSDHKKVIDVKAGRHNGIEASWIDDDRIVYVSREGSGSHIIYVIDANDGRILYGPYFGTLCHQAQQHMIAFGVAPEDIVANQTSARISTAGIYLLDCDSGVVRLVISTDVLHDCFEKHGLTLTEYSYSTSHIQINASATRMMSMWSLAEYRVIASWDMNGADVRIVHKKPVHQIWFDDNSYLATYDDRTDPHRKHGKQQMYRYSLDGEVIEYIAGLGNHVDFSPNKEWFVTDSLNYHDPACLYLFKRGSQEPSALLDSHRFLNLTWETSYHANPTFSRDGRRIYFSRPWSDSLGKACYIDISGMLAD